MSRLEQIERQEAALKEEKKLAKKEAAFVAKKEAGTLTRKDRLNLREARQDFRENRRIPKTAGAQPGVIGTSAEAEAV